MLNYPDFLVFDLSVNYAVSRHLTAGCLVSNLLDENYTEKDGFNMAGRQFRFKLNYSF
jgi:outer membrane cobalamin receptor